MASPGRRCVGDWLDLVITGFIFVLSLWLLTQMDVDVDVEAARIGSVSLSVAYFLFCDCLPNGQSMGKRLVGLSVKSARTGQDCNVIQSIFRNALGALLGPIDSLFILGKKRQRLGDKLVNTIVIKLS
ncbi:RDD family protein [Vibrio vulnificus]|uniref:RDD family protein n=1 Tax=Vibrio vulnificus TaxID=672 RepID=UPI001CDC6605|nr:RDD family protein [Vibrio vulnificus]